MASLRLRLVAGLSLGVEIRLVAGAERALVAGGVARREASLETGREARREARRALRLVRRVVRCETIALFYDGVVASRKGRGEHCCAASGPAGAPASGSAGRRARRVAGCHTRAVAGSYACLHGCGVGRCFCSLIISDRLRLVLRLKNRCIGRAVLQLPVRSSP